MLGDAVCTRFVPGARRQDALPTLAIAPLHEVPLSRTLAHSHISLPSFCSHCKKLARSGICDARSVRRDNNMILTLELTAVAADEHPLLRILMW